MTSVVEMKSAGGLVEDHPFLVETQQVKKGSCFGRDWVHVKAVGAAIRRSDVLIIWCVAVGLVSLATYALVVSQNPSKSLRVKDSNLFLSIFLYVGSTVICCIGIFAAVIAYRKTAERLRTTPQAPLLENV
jgi:hypothetical protein